MLTDRVSKYLFCPTKLAVENLKKEGIEQGVYFVGDVMYDLFLMMEPMFKYDVFELLGLEEENYIVMTLHRDFNVDNKEKFEKILSEVSKVAEKIKVVFPVHPRTRKRISEFGLDRYLKNIIVIEPIDYLNLMGLVEKSWKVITDSGGLQKEAYFAGKRAVVVMPDTSWRELVESEWNILADGEGIYDAVFSSQERPYPTGLYGNGDAGKRMVEILTK
nr:UDP-N-acetylglucosamine 2-epimerase [Fervidobacterium pennivorans]